VRGERSWVKADDRREGRHGFIPLALRQGGLGEKIVRPYVIGVLADRPARQVDAGRVVVPLERFLGLPGQLERGIVPQALAGRPRSREQEPDESKEPDYAKHGQTCGAQRSHAHLKSKWTGSVTQTVTGS
jgi:hypothetical protein